MHLLSRYSRTDLRREPFPCLLVPNAIEPALLERLESEFPDWRTFTKGKPYAENQKFIRGANELLEDPNAGRTWKDFIRAHLGTVAATHAWKVYAEDFLLKYPRHAERLGPVETWSVGIRGRDDPASHTVLLDAQLVIHTPCPTRSGIQRGPHLKNANKICETQVYFPPQHDPYGAEIRLFRVRPGKRVFFAEHNQVEPGVLETVQTAPCRPGTMLSFMIGPESFTQLGPRGPSHEPLRYFSTLIQLPFNVFEIGASREIVTHGNE